jgi:hypothetical protein
MRINWSHEFNLKQGGGGSGKSTSVTQNYSPAEAAQRAKVQSEAKRIYDQTASTIAGSPYTGAQVVPLSGDSITGQNLAKDAATQQINSINPQLAAATQFGLSDVMDVNSNPYLQASIDAAVRPITESYTDPNGVLSNIRTNSMLNGGQGTSSRQGIAEGVAAGRYANAIGDASARVASEGYGQGLDTFSKVLGLTPGTMSAMAQPAQTFSAVGAQNESLAQAQENYEADARNWDLNAAWAPLQNWANIVYGGTGANSSTTTSGGSTQRNPLMGAMGGAMSGAQLGSMIPGLGTGVGAIGGAILGGLFS